MGTLIETYGLYFGAAYIVGSVLDMITAYYIIRWWRRRKARKMALGQ